MKRNALETVIGAVVLVIAGLFVYFAYRTTGLEMTAGYPLSATFAKVGDVSVGSDVRVNGIRVGTVTSRRLDPKTYEAVIGMTIVGHVHLPVDTIASISNEGILGGKYIRLEPGTATETLASGASITQTVSYRSLEDQVGEIIFLATGRTRSAEEF